MTMLHGDCKNIFQPCLYALWAKAY